MMHVGLSHFTGRGLPTIWSFISSNDLERHTLPVFPFTDTDTKVIREWAKNLDDWLSSSNSESTDDNPCNLANILKNQQTQRLIEFKSYGSTACIDCLFFQFITPRVDLIFLQIMLHPWSATNFCSQHGPLFDCTITTRESGLTGTLWYGCLFRYQASR